MQKSYLDSEKIGTKEDKRAKKCKKKSRNTDVIALQNHAYSSHTVPGLKGGFGGFIPPTP